LSKLSYSGINRLGHQATELLKVKDPQSEGKETNAKSCISNKNAMKFKLNLAQNNLHFSIIHQYFKYQFRK